jgi:hypothetical protein
MVTGDWTAADRVALGEASNGDEISGVELLYVDVKMRSALASEARRRVVTRMFGIPRDEQSFLVTMILLGAAGKVVGDFVTSLRPHPSRADAEVAGSLVNATFRAIGGRPSQTIPFAGALIGLAVLSHALRPAVARSAREVHALAHDIRGAYDARYRRQLASPVAAGRERT